MFEINFESPEPMEMQFLNGGGGAVKSVNGQTGDVVLNAGDIDFDDSSTYSSGSVGAEVSGLKSQINDKFTFTHGKNLFNEETQVPGYISDSSGTITVRDDWVTSDFIPVTPGDDLYLSVRTISTGNRDHNYPFYFLSTYNANKTILSRSSGNTASPYTVPSGVAYIRFCYHTELWDDVQVEIGAVTPYEPYRKIWLLADSDYIRKPVLDDVFVESLDYQWEAATIAETKNNQFINSDKTISAANNWNVYIINISAGEKIRTDAYAYNSKYYYSFYNANNVWLDGLQRSESGSGSMPSTILTAPENTAYIAIVGLSSVFTPTTEVLKELSDGYSPFLKKWSGKKWVVFGDSLTEVNRRTTKHYYDYISEVTGISVFNMGNSGSGYMSEQDLNTAFYQRISSVPLDADVITIFGSFNDLEFYEDLGTKTDTGTNTIGGCINTTLDNLFAALPLANVGIVSPTPWQNSNPTTAPNHASSYCTLLKDICEMRGIPFLDLFYCSALRPWEANFRAAAYSKDDGNGTHPDETGHKIIAPRFEAFLDSLLLH